MEHTTSQLAFMSPVLAFVLGSMLLLIWRFSQRFNYLLCCGLAFILYSLASTQQVLQFPSSQAGYIVSNSILYAGFGVLFNCGLLHLGQMKPNYLPIFTVCTFYVIARIYFGVVDESRIMQIIVSYVLFSSLLFLTAWQIRGIRKVHFFEGMIFYSLIAFALALSPALLFTGFSERTAYGFDGSVYWVAAIYFYLVFFSLFYTLLLAVVATRRVHAAVQESGRDPLTGLLNRRGFEEAIEYLLPKLSHYSLVCMDLDHFKKINDDFGHPTGDTVLRMVAKKIQANIRDSDLSTRIGGEEFLLFLPNVDLATATMVAERLRADIAGKHLIARTDEQTEFQVTASFGVAEFESTTDTLSQGYRFVDGLLYEAKKQGRNRVIARHE